jgi:uncharacterized small protein (DUF1192 family)
VFTNARNPKWTGSDHKTITLEVEMNGEWVGFVASPADCTDYGPMLYRFAVNGVFGEIAASDEERVVAGDLPVPEGYALLDGRLVNVAMREQQAVAELKRRLAALNSEEARAQAELDGDYAVERKAMLAALLAVKQQPGWPTAVEWPEE